MDENSAGPDSTRLPSTRFPYNCNKCFPCYREVFVSSCISMASRLMLLGQVIGREVLKPRVINVRAVEQVFDKHINMYFAEPKDFKVAEMDVKVNDGDLVRIVKLPEKLTVEVEYEVAEVVFPIGRVVDPVTGRKCRGTQFIDEKAREEEEKRIAQAKMWENYAL